jgi:hypothetical protein
MDTESQGSHREQEASGIQTVKSSQKEQETSGIQTVKCRIRAILVTDSQMRPKGKYVIRDRDSYVNAAERNRRPQECIHSNAAKKNRSPHGYRQSNAAKKNRCHLGYRQPHCSRTKIN